MLFEYLCLADFPSSEFTKATALPYNSIMEFIKATAFTKFSSPKPGSRQDRSWVWWGSESPLGNYGKGKSGGVRVIYYFKKQDDEICLLTIYSKSE
jgi:hypothetical protein